MHQKLVTQSKVLYLSEVSSKGVGGRRGSRSYSYKIALCPSCAHLDLNFIKVNSLNKNTLENTNHTCPSSQYCSSSPVVGTVENFEWHLVISLSITSYSLSCFLTVVEILRCYFIFQQWCLCLWQGLIWTAYCLAGSLGGWVILDSVHTQHWLLGGWGSRG